MERRLYYLDPTYEKVVRVDLPNGENPKTLIHNEADLRTMVMFRKRPIPTENPCLSNQGNCDHFCIPAANNQRKCGCSVGFQKSLGGQSGRCEKFSSFSVVSQLGLARGFSLTDHREAMMPISGKGEAKDSLYFLQCKSIFISITILALWNYVSLDFYYIWRVPSIVKEPARRTQIH